MIIDCLQNPENKQVDVVITTVPWTDSLIPLMAPAVLKPIVEKAGLSCLAVDLNGEIFLKTSALPDVENHLSFFFDGVCTTSESQKWIHEMLLSIVEQILSWKPKYVGLSLFSYASQNSALWMCYMIKKCDPDVKIILGGAGCMDQFTGPSQLAEGLISSRLADYHIRGDGENSLYELLRGNNAYPGINDSTWRQLENHELASLPMPDYSDYNFGIYQKPMLPLLGSRGCVRKCTFCDYIANWTAFRWRTAEDIFDEMMEQYKKYGIRTFKFQDTLTNGNIKEFNRLMELLAKYNRDNPTESFRWGGYYIFRDQSNSDDYRWQMIKESGADLLIVGIENLNEDIRFAIGKKFSNNSIDYHLEKALEHNIRLYLLMIVGYVTETQAHIDFAKKWLDEHVKYQPIIASIQWGGGLGIYPNTWLDKNKDALGIKMTGPKAHMWINPETGNDLETRARWVDELNQHSISLGYTVYAPW